MPTLKLTKKYSTYPEYKDSGVEWLRKIPQHWSFDKLAHNLLRNDGGVWGEDDLMERGNLVLRSTEISQQGLFNLDTAITRKLSTTEFKKAKLLEGDLLVTKSSGSADHLGKTGLVTKDIEAREVAFSNFMQRLRVNKNYHPEYLYYSLNNITGREQINYWGSTTSWLVNLNASIINRFIFAIPPISEQKNIVDYLNQKTVLVEQTIEKKLRQIDFLREKRTAVINQAVTKGLDPDVELVESGIEWIGKIPKGWRIEKLKYIAPLVTKKVTKEDIFGTYVALENVESKTGKYIPSEENVEPESVVNTFAETDILFGKLRPYLAKVFVPNFSGTSTSEFLVMRPKYPKIRKYLFYRILSQEFINTVNDSTYGAQMPRANWSFIGNLPLTVPSEKEQEDIGIFLDKSTELFAQTIQKIEKSIELLQEFKSSLISHVVTGKIKI